MQTAVQLSGAQVVAYLRYFPGQAQLGSLESRSQGEYGRQRAPSPTGIAPTEGRLGSSWPSVLLVCLPTASSPDQLRGSGFKLNNHYFRREREREKNNKKHPGELHRPLRVVRRRHDGVKGQILKTTETRSN